MSRDQVSAGQMLAGLRGGVVSAPRALRIEQGALTGQPMVLAKPATRVMPVMEARASTP